MKKKVKPSLPNYIPKAEAPMIVWLNNYNRYLPILGPEYGISEASIAAALLAINGLLAALNMLAAIRSWLSQWVECNDELQYDKPKDPSVMVKWPAQPTWSALPDPITVNAWLPILDTTKTLLAKRKLSAQDRQTLMLDAYTPTQQRSSSAKYFDYPTIRLSEEGGSVVVRTQRSDRFKGMMAKYVIDYSNNGVFEDLTSSVNKELRVPIKFPTGSSMMTWTIQAIYVANGVEASQWCPPASIVLRKEGPVMASPPASQQGVDPQSLERSLKNMLENYQGQPVGV